MAITLYYYDGGVAIQGFPQGMSPDFVMNAMLLTIARCVEG